MKKETIKKAAIKVLNERSIAKKKFRKIANLEKLEENKFKKFTETLSKNELLSLKYLGNTKKLQELGLLKEGQQAGLFLINEAAEVKEVCLKNIINAGGPEGSEGSADICGSKCPCDSGCECIGKVGKTAAPGTAGPFGEPTVDLTGTGLAGDPELRMRGSDVKPACPCEDGEMRPECCPKGMLGRRMEETLKENFSGCSESTLISEAFNQGVNEAETSGGTCIEVISSDWDHIRGKLKFRNCGGCPCGGDCFCAGRKS